MNMHHGYRLRSNGPVERPSSIPVPKSSQGTISKSSSAVSVADKLATRDISEQPASRAGSPALGSAAPSEYSAVTRTRTYSQVAQARSPSSASHADEEYPGPVPEKSSDVSNTSNKSVSSSELSREPSEDVNYDDGVPWTTAFSHSRETEKPMPASPKERHSLEQSPEGIRARMAKGKTVDPRNWGSSGIPEEELDISTSSVC
ncbi:hypothetical protein BXZ70DRAFT_1066253 [Cristinia sonorae]|uniref:Uncharacterized protein n=1 Tax=Cristinia sonorae TaxID=1940300 RepID=A0A8K0UJQ0_9AGAR|nr:hypothetical protein BXZ70DRAFT_1066253 [Cristinia sonorae]